MNKKPITQKHVKAEDLIKAAIKAADSIKLIEHVPYHTLESPNILFTPPPVIGSDTDLINELKRRGYTGTLTKKIEL